MPTYFSKIPSSNIQLRRHAYGFRNSNSGSNIQLSGTAGSIRYYREDSGLNRWTGQTLGSTKSLGSFSNLAHVNYVRISSGSVIANDPNLGFGAWQGTGWSGGDSLSGWNNYSDQYMGSLTGIVNAEGPSGRFYGIRQFVRNINKNQTCLRLTYINGAPAQKSHLVNLYYVNTTDYPSGGATSVIALSGASAAFSAQVIGADYTGVWVWNGVFLESNYWVGFELT